MAETKKQPLTQYAFAVRATFSGCTGLVFAHSVEEAREKAKAGDWIDGIETNTAELVDWELQKLEHAVED